MTSSTLLNPINGSPNLSNTQGAANSSEQQSSSGSCDPLIIAYMLILDSVQISEQTGQLQAKDLQTNVNQQNDLIEQEGQVNFVVMTYRMLHTKVSGYVNEVTDSGHFIHTKWVWKTRWCTKQISSTALQSMQAKNEAVSGIRDVLEDQLNVLRQNSQVDSTNINTLVDQAQQDVQQGGNIMQMLNSLTNQISRI